MDFKDILQEDNKTIFLDPGEFGEKHLINGKEMNIVIDDYELLEREKRRKDVQAYRQGVFKKQVLFYVLGDEFGKLPPVGCMIKLDAENYTITDAIYEEGIYSISLEAQKSR
ncbi:hypothetical protein [Phocaeicola sp.]|uniref:hypothetical protein n=1 Tax=Phocaeicola sp. TaxID=2773926 RepID=UPI002A7F5DF7|nr:hypothetical protein [Phocaeicola sp.]